MKAFSGAAPSARRLLGLILSVAALGVLARSALLPAVEGADSTRRVSAPHTEGRTASIAAGSIVFPLRASADHRYLEDQIGQPFPILGRTSWAVVSLIASDYQTYIDDTAAKGFTAIELAVIYRFDRVNSRPFAGNGAAPFTKDLSGSAWAGSMSVDPDFTTPNEAYWTHVDGLLTYARSKGILCFLFPAYVGFQGKDIEGWMSTMTANGPARCQTYGAWIADRYKTFPNIVWMLGGDYGTGTVPDTFTPIELAVEQALLTGLKSVPGQQSTNFAAEWTGDSIYTSQSDATLKAAGTLQSAYTWNSVSQWCRNGYAATPAMPAFLIEGPYDQEGPDGTGVNPNATQPTRRFQWWSVFSGIGGYVTGNGYVWPFNGTDWSSHLDVLGAQDMARLNGFINSIAWQTLVPSGLGGMGTIVTAGGNTPADKTYVAAAANPAGTLLVAYVPPDHTGNITVDMTKMSAPARARWFNPTIALYTPDGASPIANSGTHVFTPLGNNGSGFTDWVLVLDVATAIPTPTPSSTPTATATPTPPAGATPTSTPTSTPVPAASTGFFPLIPCRLVDTREPNGARGGPALIAGTPRTFAVANVCNVPSTARAISVNDTVVAPSTAGGYRLHAADIPPPNTSNLSFAANQTRGNNGIVALSRDGLGRFTVQPDLMSGTAHLVVDVNGYFR